ncbi:hypothetical protein KIH74_33145 [Kineosporia sp. J2-2]|uniref:Secreted protein n=1 Tax=Kineosporia corallincola TaxID=2835133 RepID=A0ABS5TSP6_9ACTN|nr:hypothetical protein [Kineosporia corallincola]MBT0773839.1 hypothetical protein [Kineosporia corallincola]
MFKRLGVISAILLSSTVIGVAPNAQAAAQQTYHVAVDRNGTWTYGQTYFTKAGAGDITFTATELGGVPITALNNSHTLCVRAVDYTANGQILGQSCWVGGTGGTARLAANVANGRNFRLDVLVTPDLTGWVSTSSGGWVYA